MKERLRDKERLEHMLADDVVVWGVVTTDIPLLHQQIIEYLKEINNV